MCNRRGAARIQDTHIGSRPQRLSRGCMLLCGCKKLESFPLLSAQMNFPHHLREPRPPGADRHRRDLRLSRKEPRRRLPSPKEPRHRKPSPRRRRSGCRAVWEDARSWSSPSPVWEDARSWSSPSSARLLEDCRASVADLRRHLCSGRQLLPKPTPSQPRRRRHHARCRRCHPAGPGSPICLWSSPSSALHRRGAYPRR